MPCGCGKADTESPSQYREEIKMNVIRVSSKTNPCILAESVCGFMREESCVHLRAVGAAAINQAVKAIAICRINMVAANADVICTPWFSEVVIDGEIKTAITFNVELRWPDAERSAA